MHMLRSPFKSRSVTWSEHCMARCLGYLIPTGEWRIDAWYAISSGRAMPRQRVPELDSVITSELLLTIAKNFRGNLRNLHIATYASILTNYTRSEAATILDLINRRSEMRSDIEGKVPPDILNRLETALAEVENKLLTKDPLISNHLRASHQLLISYPETVHLLTDEEISNLIGAAQLHTKIEIVKATAPKTAKAAAKKASVDDF